MVNYVKQVEKKRNTENPKILHSNKTHVQLNSAFYPSGVGKASTGLSGWGEGEVCSLVSGGRCDPIWQVTPRSCEMEFHYSYTRLLTFST